MTSYRRTTWAWRHFFMIAISFRIFCSVLVRPAVRATCPGEAGIFPRRSAFILFSRGLLRLIALMACSGQESARSVWAGCSEARSGTDHLAPVVGDAVCDEDGAVLAFAEELAADVAVDHAPAELIAVALELVRVLEVEWGWVVRRHRGGRMRRRFQRRREEQRQASGKKGEEAGECAGGDVEEDAEDGEQQGQGVRVPATSTAVDDARPRRRRLLNKKSSAEGKNTDPGRSPSNRWDPEFKLGNDMRAKVQFTSGILCGRAPPLLPSSLLLSMSPVSS